MTSTRTFARRTCQLPAGLTATFTAALLLGASPVQAQSIDLGSRVAAGAVLLGNSLSGAAMRTASVDAGETPLSGQNALLYLDLAPTPGLAAGTLAADPFEGSGLAQTFSVTTAIRVRFD